MDKHAMSNFFKVWSIYRTGVSKRSGANKRSRLMKDLSERLEESEEDCEEDCEEDGTLKKTKKTQSKAYCHIIPQVLLISLS